MMALHRSASPRSVKRHAHARIVGLDGVSTAQLRVGNKTLPAVYDHMQSRARRVATPQVARANTRAWLFIDYALALAMTLATTAALISHAQLRLGVYREGYAISRASAEHDTLTQEHRKLKLEVARLKNPARLIAEASNRFNLVAPASSQMVRLTTAMASGPSPSTTSTAEAVR